MALAIAAAQLPPAVPPLYDPDPGHLWNRVHATFQVRTAPDGASHGVDTVDPLLWRETKYLLNGESHGRATAVLDEFLAANGERLIADPLRRAVFQNDLWSIFDWLVSNSNGDMDARRALMSRLVRVMRRVALGEQQIAELPDTYALAVGAGGGASDSPSSLPRDLASARSSWTAIGGTQPIVPHHAAELGRSAFIVFWRLPGGESATRDYLRKLWEFPQPFVPDESFTLARDGERRVKVNPALPPVPDGTRLALVRLLLVIDDRGTIRPTRIVQSVQLRTIRGQPAFAEWKMSRQRLFAGSGGGLQPVGPDDREFLTFSSHGTDPFERRPSPAKFEASRVLEMCPNCHQVEFAPAVETIRSLPALLQPNAFSDSRHERWSRWFTQPIVAASAKERTYEWGVLTTMWHSR
jgi:hypothetical protein